MKQSFQQIAETILHEILNCNQKHIIVVSKDKYILSNIHNIIKDVLNSKHLTIDTENTLAYDFGISISFVDDIEYLPTSPGLLVKIIDEQFYNDLDLADGCVRLEKQYHKDAYIFT